MIDADVPGRHWIEAVDRPAAIIDRDRIVRKVNRRFLESIGEDPEIPGRPCYSVLHRASERCRRSHDDCPLDLCLAGRSSARTVHLHETRGRRAATKVTMRPLPSRSGRIDEVLATFEPLDHADSRPLDVCVAGVSAIHIRMLSQIVRAAPTLVPILLVGEAGTGRRWIARLLHRLSHQAAGRFSAVDCGSLGVTNLESSLVDRARQALLDSGWETSDPLRIAPGGTLYLHELASLSPEVSAMLPPMLETRVAAPEVSSEPLINDFRWIFSSAAGLEDLTHNGGFFSDLALQIGVFPIRIPSLRERREDIPPLVDAWLGTTSSLPSPRRVSRDALEALKNYDFPGNLRELAEILGRAQQAAESRIIERRHLDLRPKTTRVRPVGEFSTGDSIVPLRELLARYVAWAVASARTNHRQLARQLGISERTLYRKLRSAREKGLLQRRREP
jgi:DNA-binding NtrC family response regulator